MAQNCYTISAGIQFSCANGIPGVKAVWLQSIDLISGFTLSSDTITALSMSGSAKMYKFSSPKFTQAFDETPNTNEENGCFGITPRIEFRSVGRTTALRNAFLAIGTSKMVALVLDSADRYWLVGCSSSTAPQNDNGLTAVNGTKLTSGMKKDDLTGGVFVLEGYTSVPAYEVSSSIVAGFTSN